MRRLEGFPPLNEGSVGTRGDLDVRAAGELGGRDRVQERECVVDAGVYVEDRADGIGRAHGARSLPAQAEAGSMEKPISFDATSMHTCCIRPGVNVVSLSRTWIASPSIIAPI